MSPKIFKDRAWLEYYTDSDVNRKGFSVQWKAQKVTTTKATTTVATSMLILCYQFLLLSLGLYSTVF